MKNLFIFLSIIYISGVATAQDQIRFSSQNYIGFLLGQKGSAPQMQTINGAKYKMWNVGIGVGINGYYSISSPVFLSLNRSVFRKDKNNFSITVNGGINLPWKNVEDHYEEAWGYRTNKLIGEYWEGGLNYKKRIKKHFLLAQFGFSYKHMGEILKPTSTDPGNPPTDILFPTYRYDYYLKAFSFKIGWGF